MKLQSFFMQGIARFVFFICVLTQAQAVSAEPEKIAITVFPQNDGAKSQVRAAQSRLESILMDNGYLVMDEQEAEKLKSAWHELEDPGYLITAEDFLEKSEQFKIDKILRAYLTVDKVGAIASFYSASAQLDIRVIDKSANVNAYTSKPMGTPGMPVSDGLTPQSAMRNAVYRSVDHSTQNIGLDVLSITPPQLVNLKLSGPLNTLDTQAGGITWLEAKSDSSAYPIPLEKKSWKTEEQTCQARDPADVYLVAGGYIKSTSGGQRSYSALLRVVDLGAAKQVVVFETNSSEKFQDKRKLGTTKILSCAFIGSWRYVIALTGDYVMLFDTERGIEMSAARLPAGIKKGRLGMIKKDSSDIYFVVEGKKRWIYQMERG